MERIVFVPGERVSLVVPEKSDIDIMYKSINNINIIKFLQPIRYNTKETEEKFLNSKLETADHFFVIMLNETKEIIGSVGFNEYDKNSRNGVIGICLYDELKLGKGYGSEALKLFLKYAFKYIGANKIKLQVFANNPRAIASYKKCGFKEVGVLKQEVYIMGEYVDSIIMEILRSEYEEINKERE